MLYRYKLMDEGMSSRDLGNCEICGKYCNDMYTLQEEYASYIPPAPIPHGWAVSRILFGHSSCLEKQKRGNGVPPEGWKEAETLSDDAGWENFTGN